MSDTNEMIQKTLKIRLASAKIKHVHKRLIEKRNKNVIVKFSLNWPKGPEAGTVSNRFISMEIRAISHINN